MITRKRILSVLVTIGMIATLISALNVVSATDLPYGWGEYTSITQTSPGPIDASPWSGTWSWSNDTTYGNTGGHSFSQTSLDSSVSSYKVKFSYNFSNTSDSGYWLNLVDYLVMAGQWGVTINKYGNWTWLPDAPWNLVSWAELGFSPLPGDPLNFEVIVTPGNITTYINGVLLANDDAPVNTTSPFLFYTHPSGTATSFYNIQYALPAPAPTATPTSVPLPDEATREWVPVAGTWTQEGADLVGQGNATDYWKQAETREVVSGDFTYTTKFKFDFTGAAVANRYYFVLRDQGGTVIRDNVKPEIAAGGIGIVFTRPDLGGRMFFFDGYENRTARYFNEYDADFQMIDAEGYITLSVSVVGNQIASLKINGNEIAGIQLTADAADAPLRPLSDIVLPEAVDGKITAGQFLSNPEIDFVLANESLFVDAEPTVAPTTEPTVAPTAEPTAEPTVAPTAEPTVAPTAEPTVAPTAGPTTVPTAEPTESPTEWEEYQPVTDPMAMFWEDTGTWTGSPYTATAGDSNDNAVSYTDFGFTAGGDDLYNLTNYRVKFDILRPATGEATPGFVVGARSREPFGGATSYDVNAMAHGISIAKFGNWTWSNYYYNSIEYSDLGNPQPGDTLSFEVLVTPNNLKLYVNGYLIADDTTTNNTERGLFGLSSRNMNLSSAVFTNIYYSRKMASAEPSPTSAPTSVPTTPPSSTPESTPTTVPTDNPASDDDSPETGDANVNGFLIFLAFAALAATWMSAKKVTE
jgi:hypothetical protein